MPVLAVALEGIDLRGVLRFIYGRENEIVPENARFALRSIPSASRQSNDFGIPIIAGQLATCDPPRLGWEEIGGVCILPRCTNIAPEGYCHAPPIRPNVPLDEHVLVSVHPHSNFCDVGYALCSFECSFAIREYTVPRGGGGEMAIPSSRPFFGPDAI